MKTRWLLFPHELPQNVRQNPAVLEGDELLRRIDPDDRLELDDVVAISSAKCDRSRGTQPVGDPGHGVQLAPGQLERRCGLTGPVLQWEHTHVDKVAAVDPFVAFCDDHLDA